MCNFYSFYVKIFQSFRVVINMPHSYNCGEQVLQCSKELSSELVGPNIVNALLNSLTAQQTLDHIKKQLRERLADKADRVRCISHLDQEAFKNLLKLIKQLRPNLTKIIFWQALDITINQLPTIDPPFFQSMEAYQKRSQQNQALLNELNPFATDFHAFLEGSLKLQEMVDDLVTEQAALAISNEDTYSEANLNKLALREQIFHKHLSKIKTFFNEHPGKNNCIYLLLLEENYFLSFIKNFFNAPEVFETFSLKTDKLNLSVPSEALRGANKEEQLRINENLGSLLCQDNFRSYLEKMPSMNTLIHEALSPKSLEKKSKALMLFELNAQLSTLPCPLAKVSYLLSANLENLRKLCGYLISYYDLINTFELYHNITDTLGETNIEKKQEKLAFIQDKRNYLGLFAFAEYDLKPFVDLDNTTKTLDTLKSNLHSIIPKHFHNQAKLKYLCNLLPIEVQNIVINTYKSSDILSFFRECNITIGFTTIKNWIKHNRTCFLKQLEISKKPPRGKSKANTFTQPHAHNKIAISEKINPHQSSNQSAFLEDFEKMFKFDAFFPLPSPHTPHITDFDQKSPRNDNKDKRNNSQRGEYSPSPDPIKHFKS